MGNKTDYTLRLLQESGLDDVKFKRVFSVRHACVYGHSQALLIQQLYFWHKKAIKLRKPDEEGNVWFYHSYTEWVQEFPYINEKSFRRWMAELEQLGIITRKIGGSGAHHRVTWMTFHLDKLAEDFSTKWQVFKQNSPISIQDEDDEKDSLMFDLGKLVPYDLEFRKSTFSQLYEDNLSVLCGHDVRIDGNDSLLYIYKEYTKNLLCRCIVQNINLDDQRQVASEGKIDFHILWDFYHSLLFGRPKVGKDRAIKNYRKLSEEQRERFLPQLIDYWFSKELDRASQDQSPHELRRYMHKFSNFCTECLSDEYDVEEFNERYTTLLKTEEKREQEKQPGSTNQLHQRFKQLKSLCGKDPSLS